MKARSSARLRYLLIVLLVRITGDLPLLGMFYFLHTAQAGEGGLRVAVTNGGLWLGFALLHSGLAREKSKDLLERVVGRVHVRAAFVVVSGLSLASLLLLWQPLAGELWRASGWLYWFLTMGFLGAVGATVAFTRYIDYLDFLGIRQLKRRLVGKPTRQPTLSLRGPYAYVRHPMYLALIGVLWIGPVMTFSRLEFASLATFYLLAGTLFEERNLRGELGPIYDTYRQHVRMWIPRFSPWRPDPGQRM